MVWKIAGGELSSDVIVFSGTALQYFHCFAFHFFFAAETSKGKHQWSNAIDKQKVYGFFAQMCRMFTGGFARLKMGLPVLIGLDAVEFTVYVADVLIKNQFVEQIVAAV